MHGPKWRDGRGEEGLDSRHIWKVDPAGIAGIVPMGYEKEEPRKIPVSFWLLEELVNTRTAVHGDGGD